MPGAVAEGEVRFKGYQELLAALKTYDRDVRLGMRRELRQAVEPVRATAESLARSEIRNIGQRWPRMRIGITKSSLYVAPRERGIKTRGYDARRRPNLAGLLMDRAMQPALDQHAEEAVRQIDGLLDREAARFNRG
jgi:hypothetical protein